MTKLSVNINKIATLRNARGGDVPSVLDAAINCQKFGADGITVHPRPDERHIKYEDVRELSKIVVKEFNVEGNPNPSFIDLVKEVKPTQVTLVPDADDAITSNAGWDTLKYQNFLTDVTQEFQKNGIRVSLFLDPNPKMIESALATGANRIELYTEAYAQMYREDRSKAIAPYKETAALAQSAGLEINAGHDLSLDNIAFFSQEIPYIKEVSIGHALISEALYLGLENTIQLYKSKLDNP